MKSIIASILKPLSSLLFSLRSALSALRSPLSALRSPHPSFHRSFSTGGAPHFRLPALRPRLSASSGQAAHCALSLFLALCSLHPALSQVPQGFNYQAIARDISGNPITDPIDVKILILSDDDPETIVREEQFSSVDPNDQGLFSLVIGTGTWLSGVANFSDIDWTETTKYIKTKIYYLGEWKDLGAAQLWSVPYAMMSKTSEQWVNNGTSVYRTAGNVGIGTSTPAYTLDVNGTTNFSSSIIPAWIELTANSTGNRYSGIDFHGDDFYTDYGLRIVRDIAGQDAYSRIMQRGLGALQLYTNEAAPIDFYTAATHRLRLGSNGYLGIGTSTPAYRLDVNGEVTSRSSNAFRLRQSTYSSILRNDNSDFYILLTNSGDPDGTWNTLRPFNIDLATGNVGIGTQNGSSKLVVQAPGSWSDDIPLFEVKNKAGIPVFSVFNYGVRILVDHTDSKAAKGGFAVSGYDYSKAGGTVNLMTVSPDSIRFNIDKGSAKGLKGGFAVGSFIDSKGSINEDFMYLTPNTNAAGYTNVRMGYEAGKNARGNNNTLIGFQAGYSVSMSNAAANIFIGDKAGLNNNGGYDTIVFNGQQVIQSWGGNNVCIGYYSGRNISGTSFPDGNNNVFLGNFSGWNTTTASNNTILGSYAGQANVTGSSNVFVGKNSGYNSNNNNNVYVGYEAGYSNTSGSGNVFIGRMAGKDEMGSNKLYISNSSSSSPLIYGDFNSGLLKINGTLQLTADFDIDQVLNFPDPDRSLVIGGTSAQYAPYAIHLTTAGSGYLGEARLSVVQDNVGIGVTAPGFRLDVRENHSNGFAASISNTAGGVTAHGLRVQAGSNTSSGAFMIRFQRPDGTTIGHISQSGSNAVDYNTSSDIRVKENLRETNLSLFNLLNIKVYDFNFIGDDPANIHSGFIAQELYEVLPAAVTKPENPDDTWMVDYSKVSPLVVKAIQEQQAIIEAQNDKIARLEKLVEQLLESR